jgi:prevent-host-death family protein
MREIQLRDAKASLSAVVDEAMQGKPAVISRHGKRKAVVVSYEEWRQQITFAKIRSLIVQISGLMDFAEAGSRRNFQTRHPHATRRGDTRRLCT